MAMQANLEHREISPEVVEDLKHHRYKDDTRDKILNVNSSSGNSGTVTLGIGATPLLQHLSLSLLLAKTQTPLPKDSFKESLSS